MKSKAATWCALSLFLLLALRAQAEDFLVIALPVPEAAQGKRTNPPGDKEKTNAPEKEKSPAQKKEAREQPLTTAFTQTPTRRGEITRGVNPHMMGDQFGFFALMRIPVLAVQTTTAHVARIDLPPITKTVTQITNETVTVRVPVAVLGAFNIAENASPRPVDRVFFTYNYYSDISGPQTPGNFPQSVSQATTTTNAFGGVTNISTTTLIPGVQPHANVNREVFGFERTFLDGFASIEVRAPLLQQTGDFTSQNFGYMTFIGKYAFVMDNTTGNVLSGGFAVTAPTGPSIPTLFGNIHSTLLQPWGGCIWNVDRWFVQGFSSLIVPTDSSVPILLFNDLGLSYWLYRAAPEQRLNFVVPTVEAHVIDPLTLRNADSPISIPDTVILTGGVHVGFFRRAVLSVGVATPITGPRIFDIEAFAQLNWRF